MKSSFDMWTKENGLLALQINSLSEQLKIDEAQ